MNAWLMLVGVWLIGFGFIATAVMAAAMLLRLLLRDPGSRVLLAWGTWLAIAVGAVLIATPWWPRYEWKRFVAPPSEASSWVVVVDEELLPEPAAVVEPIGSIPRPKLAEPVSGQTWGVAMWPEWLAIAWVATAAAAGGWMAVGWFQAWRLVRMSRRAPPWIVEELGVIVGNSVGNFVGNALRGVPSAAIRPDLAAQSTPRRACPNARRLPVVRISEPLMSAVALGAMRPQILLPAESAVESNVKGIRAALAHEWAHIRHGDLWLLAIERWLLPLLALHPLFWWLRRATRLDQELLADAAAAGDKPVEYAEALVAWARAAPPLAGLTALAMSEHPSNLSRRVYMILHSNRCRSSRLSKLCGCLAAVMVLVLAAGLSLVTPQPVAAQQPPAETPPAIAVEPPADPAVPLPAPPAAAPASAAPTAIEPSAPDPADAVEAPLATRAKSQERPVITLNVTLMVRDFDRVTWSQIRSIGDLERVEYKESGGTDRHVLKVELVDWAANSMIEKLEAMEGLRTLCRSKVIAFSGQRAEIAVSEQGPRVEIEPRDENTQTLRLNQSQDIQHIVSVTPRTTADPGRVELTVFGGRLKLEVGVGNTLMLVSTASNEVLFISPTSVQRQRVRVSASTTAPALPSASLPRPATAGRAPAASASAFPNLPALAAATKPIVPVVPVTPASISPAIVPANVPSAGTMPLPATPTIPPPPTSAANPGATPVRTRATTTRLDGPEAAPTLPSAERRAHETQRKLLELDLAAAKLEVEAAQVELDEVQEIRKKSPSAVSEQELRKRQLQVERAKIQVQRIEVQLEADAKPEAPRSTTPKPAGR